MSDICPSISRLREISIYIIIVLALIIGIWSYVHYRIGHYQSATISQASSDNHNQNAETAVEHVIYVRDARTNLTFAWLNLNSGTDEQASQAPFIILVPSKSVPTELLHIVNAGTPTK